VDLKAHSKTCREATDSMSGPGGPVFSSMMGEGGEAVNHFMSKAVSSRR
jgi:hypothetical protein